MLHHFENDKFLHIVIQEFLDLDYLHILAKIANIGIFGHFWPFVGWLQEWAKSDATLKIIPYRWACKWAHKSVCKWAWKCP